MRRLRISCRSACFAAAWSITEDRRTDLRLRLLAQHSANQFQTEVYGNASATGSDILAVLDHAVAADLCAQQIFLKAGVAGRCLALEQTLVSQDRRCLLYTSDAADEL